MLLWLQHITWFLYLPCVFSYWSEKVTKMQMYFKSLGCIQEHFLGKTVALLHY